MSTFENDRRNLIELSHELGAEHRQLAILGEGNTSAKLSDDAFIVKASGSNLGTLRDEDVVACHATALLALLNETDVSDEQIEQTLLGCRLDAKAKKPSVEALFHAYLLGLPGINFVGHTHPTAVNSILCSPLAEKLATSRLFPDEVVCCGPRSVFVPYTDPGLRLAQLIRDETQRFMETSETLPRVILLQNHGIITLGASPGAVKSAMFMAVKAAQTFVGAMVLGGPVFLSESDIERIANRRDEHHRQRALGF